MTRVAVIGAGHFGKEHLAVYAALPDVELIGVLDPDPTAARYAAKTYDITMYPGLDALLADAPDAVSLVVPAADRGDLIPRLVAAGVAVLIEKPLAADPATADALARDYAALPVLCGHTVRFAKPYVQLHDRDLGELAGIHATRIRDADHATLYPTEDVVGLTMVHDLDVLNWFAGSRDWTVTASGDRIGARWVAATAVLRTDGLTATVEAAWRGDVPFDRLIVEGSQDSAEATIDTYDEALRAELEHFLECARSGTASDIIGLGSAAAAVRLVAAVREALDGGEVHVST